MRIFKFRKSVGFVLCIGILCAFIMLNEFLHYYYQELRRTEAFLSDRWHKDCLSEKNGQLKICNREFAILNNVLVEPLPGKFEDDQDPKPSFTLKCDSLPKIKFHHKNHVNNWYKNTVCSNDALTKTHAAMEKRLTIMVRRYEYANLYHTMTDFYNVFILMKALGASFNETSILLWDFHSTGLLDDVWFVLYKNVYTIADVHPQKLYRTLVWSILGYNSPLSAFQLPKVPFIEEFSHFYLSQYNLTSKTKLNCDRISILFVWRHDYIAHPGNPTGIIQRKILNEQEIFKAVQKENPTDDIKGVQMDHLLMKEQLKLITTTDILIGMHGAGLTNALFLPKHAGLIELFPYAILQIKLVNGFLHFESIARWRNLKYLAWRNPDKDNQFPYFYTRIWPEAVVDLVKQMKEMICHER